MVRRLSRVVTGALLVLPLSACIFVLSPFPATLSQVVARSDLSTVVPAGQGQMYRPFIVTPTGGDFVILLSNAMSVDPVAVVLDSDLHLIQTYTSSQLSAWGFTGGWLAITDAIGDAVIGSLRFSASELSTVGAAPTGGSIGTSLNSPGFGSPSNGTNEVNFTVAGNLLTYSRYSNWASLGTSSGLQINAAGGSYWIEAVFNVDDTVGAGSVVLVLTEAGNSSNVTFVALPLVDVTLNTLLSPLLSAYPSRSYTNLQASSIGFAGDSIVAYSYDAGLLNRYSPSTFDKISSLLVGRTGRHDPKYAYKATGGWSVVFDPESRTLDKVANWW